MIYGLLPYEPKLPLWDHQLRMLIETWDLPSAALTGEQRTGKTPIVLHTAGKLFSLGRIRTLLVLAPSGVHVNWIEEGARDHLPSHLWDGFYWNASKAHTKTWLEMQRVKLETLKLLIVSINAESITHETCKRLYKWLRLKRGPFLLDVDESTIIGTPGAKRTKTTRALARHAAYRRITNGTPAPEGPFKLFAQYDVLDPEILGFDGDYAGFKHHHAEWEQKKIFVAGEQRTIPAIKENDAGEKMWRNLGELAGKIAPYTWRVTRAQLRKTGAQEKIFDPYRFELTGEQRRVYTELRDRSIADLCDGRLVSVDHALTRLLRLQQVASNYYPPSLEAELCVTCGGDGCDTCQMTGSTILERPLTKIDTARNPREDALEAVVKQHSGDPLLVWARFTHDIEISINVLERLGLRVGRYDGKPSQAEKLETRLAFKAGSLDAIVGHQKSGARGLDFSRAKLAIYYSNAFSGEDRIQSEDRPISLAKDEPTWYVDLIAENTVDDRKILPALREKRNVSALLVGDDPGDWL